ncbi:ABC transporter ATP-binding protein [Fluviispira multicolorata]|uniref:ATP-binding cassette domain-containing protein n=1 Tax=Fluviispira multicolorata TaxID=2654512 RepID=A0A833JF81_9BACT|nr:ABC transporter ATP-binding protein [Fluviispira multicolorata]KAB8033155.1 ATP-binding cassette domain-containing protein [Fluviispira multicolorata]
MNKIKCTNLSVSYFDKIVLNNVNIKIEKNKITALIGSNGSGKSTLLKTIARIIQPSSGQVYLDGKLIQSYSSQEVARILSILPQSPEAPQEFTVERLVQYGRFPRQSFFGSLNQNDYEAIEWALKSTHMIELKNKRLSDLSGGQRQRAWIAMALAQESEYIFLDEPTTYLDMRHQIEVLNILQSLNKNQNKTIVMVVHDINHAAKIAHNVIAIKNGQVFTDGTIKQILDEKVIENIFGVKGIIINDKLNNIPLFFPLDVVLD